MRLWLRCPRTSERHYKRTGDRQEWVDVTAEPAPTVGTRPRQLRLVLQLDDGSLVTPAEEPQVPVCEECGDDDGPWETRAGQAVCSDCLEKLEPCE